MEIQNANKNPISLMFNKAAMSVDGMQDAAFVGLLEHIGGQAEEGVPSFAVGQKDSVSGDGKAPLENKAEKAEKKQSKPGKVEEKGVSKDNKNRKDEEIDDSLGVVDVSDKSVNEQSKAVERAPLESGVVEVGVAQPVVESIAFEGDLGEVSFVADGQEYTLSDFLAEPRNLSLFDSVSVLNPQTQAVVTMSGQEFASTVIKNIVDFENAYSSAGKIDISGLEILSPDEFQLVEPVDGNNNEVFLLPDADNDFVAENVDDFIAKVERDFNVDVEIESVSQKLAVSADELVKDKAQINILAFSKQGDVSGDSQMPSSEVLTVPGEQYVASPAVSKIVPDAYSNVSAVAFTENVQPVMASEVGGTISVSSAGIVGGAAASGRTDSLNSRSDTSFKDVYKGLGKDVVEQVKINIVKSAVKGIDKIDISLKPQELGNIEIKMQLAKDGRLNAHIVASRPETVEMLQKETSTLEQAFRDAGFQMEDGSLSFSLRDDGQANENKEKNSSLRDFLGDAFEGEDVNDFEMASGESWGQNGLNIRV